MRDQNAKVGSQETPGVTGKFGFGVQNEAGQRLIECSFVLPKERTGHSNYVQGTMQDFIRSLTQEEVEAI